jgi:hypothetical protein
MGTVNSLDTEGLPLMAKHRRTFATGRHRRLSSKGHQGLVTATAAGLLTGALFVSGASAAERTDEQTTGTEDIQPSADERWVEQTDPVTEDVQPPIDEQSPEQADPVTDAAPVEENVQPSAYEQSSEQADPVTEDQQPIQEAQPGAEGEQSDVDDIVRVNEVEGVRVFRIVEGDDAAQAGPDSQPSTGEPDDQGPPIEGGDRIQPKGIPLGTDGCSAGFNVTDGESSNFLLTAAHCHSERGWTTDSGRDIGQELEPREEMEGKDYLFVKNQHPADPEDFTEVGEAYVGQEVCARGATTAEVTGERESCGRVTAVDQSWSYDKLVKEANGVNELPVYEIGPTVDDLIETDIHTRGGDSGGPLYDRHSHEALGTLNGGNGDGKDTCGNATADPDNCALPSSAFYPVSASLRLYPEFHLGVAPKPHS